MIKKRKNKKEILMIVLFTVVLAPAFVKAYYQDYQPNVISYYTREGVDYRSFWPNLENKDLCKARQDFIVNIRPGSCMPSVVRSDLLEEQNVPVFCKLDAIKINPLIKVLDIKSVRIKGKYPKEIAGIGFHPSRAAVRMYATKIDNPFMSDLGYVVIKLRRMPEREMKDYVEANLTAILRYDIEKAFGIGNSLFYLPLLDEKSWEDNYVYYGFWNGKAYLRLNDINKDLANIFIYTDKNHIYKRVNLKVGDTSNVIYLPGFYCMAGIKLRLDDISVPKRRVLLEIDGVRNWISEGESFLDGKCVVSNIIKEGENNIVKLRCGGNIYTLTYHLADVVKINVNGKSYEVKVGGNINNLYLVYYGYWNDKTGEKEFIVFSSASKKVIENGVINKNIIDSFISDFEIKNDMDYNAYKERIKKKVASTLGVDEKEVHILEMNEEKEIKGKHYKFVGAVITRDKKWGNDVEEYFKKAKETAYEIVDYYGNEEYNGKKIGKEVLMQLYLLAEKLKKFETEKEIIEKLIKEDYVEGSEKEALQRKLKEISKYDYEEAIKYVKIGDEIHVVRLIKVVDPSKEEANAEFYVKGANESFDKKVGLNDYLYYKNDVEIKLKDLEEESATLLYSYYDKEGNKHYEDLVIRVGKTKRVRIGEDYVNISLLKVNLKYMAKVYVIPEVPNAESEVNFSVKIGIEKRAIKLSPEKIREMIKELNKSIEKWEGITTRLGNVVKSWKGACLATSTVLTIKNFFENLGGKASARKIVMRGKGGWNEKCEQLVEQGKFKSMDECFSANADKIDNAVNKVNEKIKEINERIRKATVVERQGIFGSVVDSKKTALNFAKEFKNFLEKNKDVVIKIGNEERKLKDVLKSSDVDRLIDKGLFGVEDMRDLMLYGELLQDNDVKDISKLRFDDNVRSLYERISMPLTAESLKDDVAEIVGKNVDINIIGTTRKVYVKDIINVDKGSVEKGEYVAIVVPMAQYAGKILFIPVKKVSDNVYGYDDKRNIYAIGSKDNVEIVTETSELLRNFGGGIFEKISKDKCENKYINPEVRFFETQPYKGLPQLVPLDVNKGWYVGIKPSTSFFGKSVYTQSGMVSVFWICNVGENGLEEFNRYGDDICTRIDVMSGQPIDQIYCLSENEARNMVRKAISVIERVAAQYGNKMINVPGVGNFPGKTAKISDERQCQDFMSPKDCNILFNVCDPVICPSSRCDLGGRYRVDNVIQSGIIGSLILCLPNFGSPSEGGVIVPVCLSGLYAGLDSYISVLKAHRDCLKENLESGRYIGICDEIYSIYLCEFFWRQAAPLLREGIPKIIEYVYYGSKARGGGEYAVINDAWKNMENSFNYFTTYYGQNAFKAFRRGSTAEVGTEICKAFVSARYPTSKNVFEQMLEPESPVQFYARFDEIPFSDATVPPTSHYKVYYHIYAGRDEGVYYSVYLKMSPEAVTYYGLQQPTIVVDTGYIVRGGMVDKTKDFTAPSGYKELCVRINAKEHCGFGQVTTDFALNYLRDKYVENELRKKINSEEECVSGSFNVYGLINPNLQEGIASSFGSASKIGITRICATHPPDGKIYGNKSRWIPVGYCDKNKGIICWLDSESVKESMKGIGIQNKTLVELKNEAEEMFEKIRKKIGIMSDEEADEFLRKIEAEKNIILNKIERGELIDLKEFEGGIYNFIDKAPLNSYKARALKFKFDVYVKLCEKRVKREKVEESKSKEKKERGKGEERKEENKSKEEGVKEESEKKGNESKKEEGKSSEGYNVNEEEKELYCGGKDKKECQKIIGNKIIQLIQQKKNSFGIDNIDEKVRRDTGAKSFECLILMLAMQESSLTHCKFNKEDKRKVLYCDNNISDVLVSIGSGEESYGVMQINKKVHKDVNVASFDDNVDYGVNYLVSRYKLALNHPNGRYYSCTGKIYKGWKLALRYYNGWFPQDCNKGDIHYVENVLGNKDYIKNLFPEFC